MVKRLTLLFAISLLLFGLSPTVSADITTLQASIDRNPVMEREAFVLKIEANASINTNDLDLSVLKSTNLNIGRTATSSNTQIVNGSIARTTTWDIVLVAQTAGDYTIPAFEIEGVKSKPIKVEVVKKSSASQTKNETIYITNQLEPQKVYVQQSIKLTSRLHISPQVELQSGRLSEPTLDGAIIKQHGKDKDASQIVNGIRYRVIERVYTITPQASGQFTIQSPDFNGDIISRNGRRSSFSSFIQSKPVTAFGEDFEIEVLPIPADYQGAWLPSDLVQLNEEWQPQKDTFEVGEPITRTFTLTALNVSEEQLPDIVSQYPADFSVYPDKSDTHSVVRNNALVSQRISSEAVVPNKPGTFTLPEIKLNWFNAKVRRLESAVLPARTITVTAPKDGTALTVQDNDNTQALSSEHHSCDCNQSLSDTPQDSENNAIIAPEHLWIVMLVGAMGWAGMLIFVVLYIRSNKRVVGSVATESLNGLSNSQHSQFDIKELQRACNSNQPALAYAQLIKWVSAVHPDCRNLQEFEANAPAALVAKIKELKAANYSPTKANWQGRALWTAIEAFNNRSLKSIAAHGDDALPPLNPKN